MSTLLDALKKSERARRLARTPTYREVGAPRTSLALRSVSLIAIVTLVAALAWSGWIVMGRPAPTPTPASTPDVGASAESSATPAPVPVPVTVPVTRVSEPPAAAAATATETRTVSRPRAVAKPPVSAARTSGPPAVPPRASDAPWWSELPAGVRDRLPPLVVNIHVYSPNAAQRILYINNHPCQPGQEIDGGVVVEEILPDGVLLRFDQQYFRLPRPT